jgi:hypothetical protein
MKALKKMSVRKMHKLGLTGDWREYGRQYRVLVARGKTWNGRPLVQISIKRHDGKPLHPLWRDKQAIKNQVVGEECEGIELYPAESRKHDQVNQYHLWAIDDRTFRFPFGWPGRVTLDDDDTKGELVEE